MRIMAQVWNWVRGITICLALLLPGCASLKDSARDAAREALAEAVPAIKEAGRELASHASREMEAAGGRLLTQAKDDIPGAIKAIIPELKGATADAATSAIAARVASEDPAKASEFERIAKAEGLPAALEWLFGGGGIVAALGLARLYWRTRGALKIVAKAAEASPEVKATVAAHGGKVFDSEIQAALK